MVPSLPDVAGDDSKLDGYLVSHAVVWGPLAALDHVTTLRQIADSEKVTMNGMWTLLRGVIEPAASAVWIAGPSQRKQRRTRALRTYYYDFDQRKKWSAEIDRVDTPTSPAKIRAVAKALGIEESAVTSNLNQVDIVGDSAILAGLERKPAIARWRECSGFAHGRLWPQPAPSQATGAAPIVGGAELRVQLNESHYLLAADLASRLLHHGIDLYAERSASRP
jgi:hypothetical protein